MGGPVEFQQACRHMQDICIRETHKAALVSREMRGARGLVLA